MKHKPIILELTESEMRQFRANAVARYPWIVRENIIYKVEMKVTYRVELHDENDLDLVPESEATEMELLDL